MSHSKLGSSGDKTLNVTAMISLIKTKSSNAQIAEMLHCFSAAKKLKPHPAAQTKKKKKQTKKLKNCHIAAPVHEACFPAANQGPCSIRLHQRQSEQLISHCSPLNTPLLVAPHRLRGNACKSSQFQVVTVKNIPANEDQCPTPLRNSNFLILIQIWQAR